MLVFAITSCTKESKKDDSLSASATNIWQEAYEVDGCVFFVKIDNHEYKPAYVEILNESFRFSENQTA